MKIKFQTSSLQDVYLNIILRGYPAVVPLHSAHLNFKYNIITHSSCPKFDFYTPISTAGKCKKYILENVTI